MKAIRYRAPLALLVIVLATGCGLENSLVGGRCRAGLVLSGDTCVPDDVSVVASTEPPPDAQAPADLDAGSLPDSRAAHPTVVPLEDASSDGASLYPTLPPPRPVLVEQTDAAPPLACPPPTVLCRGVCIPVDSDPANCDACGKVCPSNICVNGECQGATPGDVILIGHDYTNATVGTAQTKVLINALTIPTTDPIRILSFEEGASPAAVAQLKYLANASIKNRSVSFTRAGAASDLASSSLGRAYDIVIINDASAVDAVATGQAWAAPLGTFAAKGGVIVALDDGSSPIPQLLTRATLLAVGSHALLPASTHLLVTAAADVIGAQVLSPYATFGAPVAFQGLPAPSDDLTWVVRAKNTNGTSGDPVVIHRVVR